MKMVPVFDRYDFDKINPNLIIFLREIFDFDSSSPYVQFDLNDKLDIDILVEFQKYAKEIIKYNFQGKIILNLS